MAKRLYFASSKGFFTQNETLIIIPIQALFVYTSNWEIMALISWEHNLAKISGWEWGDIWAEIGQVIPVHQNWFVVSCVGLRSQRHVNERKRLGFHYMVDQIG